MTTPPTAPPAGQPAAPRKTSPWVFGLIGCGGILVVLLIALLVIAQRGCRRVQDFARDAERNPAIAAARMIVRMNPDLEEVSSDAAAGTITIRNRKTGETINVNAEDIQQGRISFSDETGQTLSIDARREGESGRLRIESDEGTFEMRTGREAETPSWVPAYPGAADAQAWTMQGPDGITGTLSFTAAERGEAVLAHYEQALRRSGFEIVNRMTHTSNGSRNGMLQAAHAGEKRQVTVIFSEEGDRVQVNVTYGPN